MMQTSQCSAPPLLTVGIPTYNSAHFLRECVGSVERQGLDDYEIVIFDNASEDNTDEVIRSLGNPRIRYFRNPSNLGSRANHNRCLSEARGRYFKFLCADDILLEGVLEKQISILNFRADVTLVSCHICVTDANLQAGKFFSFFPGEGTGSRLINSCLSGLSNYIGGPSNFMFRLADARGITFDPSYSFVSDLKFGLQLLQRGNYLNIDQAGYLYRRHPLSDTEMSCPVDIRMMEFLRLTDEFRWWNPLSCAQAARLGGVEGRNAAFRNWLRACAPKSVINAAAAVPDVLRMRLLTRT